MINSQTGFVTTVAGNGTSTIVNGLGTQASFNAPMGIAIDRNGVVYVSEEFVHRVRRINKFLTANIN